MASSDDVVGASIADLGDALSAGRVSAVALLECYLERIAAYDPGAASLNAIVALNPDAHTDAFRSDARRSAGLALGPLDGIPYTVKDSYLVRGLTAAAGSPAFENLIAQRDAFVVNRLRAAGAVLGRAYQHAADGQRSTLLRLAVTFEATGSRRTPPRWTPALP